MKTLIKKCLAIIFGYGTVLTIFIFLGKILYQNWETLKQQDWSIRWILLFLAVAIGMFIIVFRYLIYRYILLKIDQKLIIKHNELFKIFLYSWLARYLPGKIWLPVGKVYFGIKLGIDKEILIISSLFELIFSTIGHLLLAIIAFLIFYRYLYSTYYLFLFFLIIGVIIGIIFIQRPVIIFIMNKMEKNFFGNKKPFILFTNQDMLKTIGYYFLLTLGMSLSFLVFITSTNEIDSEFFPAIMGSFVIANFLANLSFFAPAGLGVKEGILTVLMSPLVSLPIAIKVTLSSRIFFILLDLWILFLYKTNEKILSR